MADTRRACTAACYFSTAPASQCRCACGGANHGKGNQQADASQAVTQGGVTFIPASKPSDSRPPTPPPPAALPERPLRLMPDPNDADEEGHPYTVDVQPGERLVARSASGDEFVGTYVAIEDEDEDRMIVCVRDAGGQKHYVDASAVSLPMSDHVDPPDGPTHETFGQDCPTHWQQDERGNNYVSAAQAAELARFTQENQKWAGQNLNAQHLDGYAEVHGIEHFPRRDVEREAAADFAEWSRQAYGEQFLIGEQRPEQLGPPPGRSEMLADWAATRYETPDGPDFKGPPKAPEPDEPF